MKRTFPFALVAGLAVATAGIGLAVSQAHAGDATAATASHHHSMFDMLDTNHDGVIDQQEWDAHFAALDKNGDGKLTRDEVAAAMGHFGGGMPPEAVAFFIGRMADANHDGKVTQAEWQAFIAKVDTNGDGFVTVDEIKALHAAHDHGDVQRHADMGNALPPFLAHWDTDGDGRLSTAELMALFKAADKNGDGVLDQNDHPDFHGHFQHR